MNIARVFPTKTKMSPIDDDAYFGSPELNEKILNGYYDEAHISCVFTWDIKKAEKLKYQWEPYCKVKIGGPAYGDQGGRFQPGMYLRKGVVITSRGCNKKCKFCFVPIREGRIRELPVKEGNIIQDNNLLGCSKKHKDKVFQMLKQQKDIQFAGGLDKFLLNDATAERLRGLSIGQMFLSYDSRGHIKGLKKAVQKLSKYFKRRKIRCYVLIGYNNDTIEKAEKRLFEAAEAGTLPFAMRYKNAEGEYDYKEREWNLLAYTWTRPAATKARMLEKGII